MSSLAVKFCMATDPFGRIFGNAFAAAALPGTAFCIFVSLFATRATMSTISPRTTYCPIFPMSLNALSARWLSLYVPKDSDVDCEVPWGVNILGCCCGRMPFLFCLNFCLSSSFPLFCGEQVNTNGAMRPSTQRYILLHVNCEQCWGLLLILTESLPCDMMGLRMSA